MKTNSYILISFGTSIIMAMWGASIDVVRMWKIVLSKGVRQTKIDGRDVFWQVSDGA